MNKSFCFKDDSELNLFLDHETSGQRYLELERHLTICLACGVRYEVFRQLKHLLAKSQIGIMAPRRLREKIENEIDSASKRGFRIRESIVNFFLGRPLISIGAASSLAIIFIFFLFLKSRTPENPQIISAMVGEHIEYIENFASSYGIQTDDPALISEWLRINEETEIVFPEGSVLPDLFGACTLDEGGKHIVCLFFDKGEKRVSLFITADEFASFKKGRTMLMKNVSVLCGNCTGNNYVAWSRDGYLRVLVSRLPEEDLLKMAEVLI